MEFNTYEEYLDSQVTDTDMSYLEDAELARQLLELGSRGQTELLSREDFEARKVGPPGSCIPCTLHPLHRLLEPSSAYPALGAWFSNDRVLPGHTFPFVRARPASHRE
eukprot:scaffold4675_cov378-Prasinococcus_capsulatus_cf.AAC.12